MYDAEKRKIPRVVSVHLVNLSQTDARDGIQESFMGRTLNISEGGILVEVSKYCPVSTDLLLSISMEDDLLHVKGRVSHLRELSDDKVGLGIKFLDLSASDHQMILDFMERMTGA